MFHVAAVEIDYTIVFHINGKNSRWDALLFNLLFIGTKKVIHHKERNQHENGEHQDNANDDKEDEKVCVAKIPPIHT